MSLPTIGLLPHAGDGSDLHFIVGQDPQGLWLAIETHCRGGGLFKSREDALRYVDLATRHRPGIMEMSTEPLQLRF